MHGFGQALCLDVSKYLRCLKWKRKRLPSAPSLANCSSKLLPKGSLTAHGFKVDAIKNIFCTSMIARKVKHIYCIYLWLLVNNSDISSPLLPESLTVTAWHPWLHCSMPCFVFQSFFGWNRWFASHSKFGNKIIFYGGNLGHCGSLSCPRITFCFL